MTVHEVRTYLEQLAPREMQASWDNTGLLLGDSAAPVTKILVALDPFFSVCQEAAEIGADLLVTHHPLIFRPAKALVQEDPVGRCALFLARHGISAINAHTNLDCANGGVNDTLAQVLGLQGVEVLEPQGLDRAGRPWGLLRAGTVEETELETFLSRVRQRLGTPVLRYADGGNRVHRVAVGGGACADELEAVAAAGCDTFVTADVKYNQFWDAQDRGITIVDAGHFYTENPICAVLAEKLQARFPEIPVLLSKSHADCMKFSGNG